MDFMFGRRNSKESATVDEVTADANSRGSFLRSSLSEGSSRLFGSLTEAKSGLVNGLSSVGASVLKKVPGQTGSPGSGGTPESSPQPSPRNVSPMMSPGLGQQQYQQAPQQYQQTPQQYQQQTPQQYQQQPPQQYQQQPPQQYQQQPPQQYQQQPPQQYQQQPPQQYQQQPSQQYHQPSQQYQQPSQQQSPKQQFQAYGESPPQTPPAQGTGGSKQPPPKPAPPRRGLNGGVPRQMSAEAPSRPPPPRRPLPARQVSLPSINFDEPMFNPTEPFGGDQAKRSAGPTSSSAGPANDGSNSPPTEDSIMRLRQEVEALTKQDVPDPISPRGREPRTESSQVPHEAGSTTVTAQVHTRGPPQIPTVAPPSHPPPPDTRHTSQQRAGAESGASSDRSVFGSDSRDLLPGIPRVPSVPAHQGAAAAAAASGPQSQDMSQNNTGGLLSVGQRDLLAITPTSGEALPIPDITPQVKQASGGYHSDAESSATGGCDEPEDRYRDFEGEDSGGRLRSGSVGSDRSWSEEMEYQDEFSKECMQFMKTFVTSVFDPKISISQSDKAKFGELCRQGPGRLWFSRYISAQRVSSKRVEEQIFYRLVQYFAVCLFECGEEEDYVPAKILMNMCFTFYYEVDQPMSPTHRETAVSNTAGITSKHFLYSYLKDQPIWQSLRFWNAAFFDAVMAERARRPAAKRGAGSQEKVDDQEYQENITFGQLATFTSNMRAFGLSKELCLEFLRKQSTIADLRKEQIKMLRENIEKWQD